MRALKLPALKLPAVKLPAVKLFTVKLPAAGELLFSLKCFGAAMLALYVALAAGLPRPFWAMLTAYIVASPLSGAVRSKALFRVCGTLIGAGATIVMVPRLANAPELLSLAIACWVGLCLYVSLLDRTPRSYVFMLAGYTAGLIGFPAVADPGAVFDTGLARVEEITIGILAATLVHSLVLPQGVGPALLQRLDRALADAQRWMAAALMPGVASPGALQTRLALAGEISALRLMGTHLPFDTSQLRWTADLVHGLHDRLTVMVPLLLAVEDRLRAIEAVDAAALTPRWRRLLGDIHAWVGAGHDADPARAAQLRAELAELAQLAPALAAGAGWCDILLVNLVQRLDALIAACEDSLALRAGVNGAMRGRARADFSSRLTPNLTPHLPPSVLHLDHGMALRSALAAVLAILVCCAFWIGSGWPSGAAAPMMAGVFCCFFATQDDPVPAIKMFIKWTLLSMPVGALYILCVLPAVHSFEMLALAIAPFFLLAGAFMARADTVGQALAFIIGVAGTMSLQDTGTLDIPVFLNGMLAQMVGYIAAGVITALVRTVSGDWMARRMLRMARREIAQLAQAATAPPLPRLAARMVDRIGLLLPRLAMGGERTDALEALRDLRAGLHIAQLRAMQRALEQGGVELRPLLADLAGHFGTPATSSTTPSVDLLERLDATLRSVCAHAGAETRPLAAAALASMRRDLFPAAGAYQPTLTETVA